MFIRPLIRFLGYNDRLLFFKIVGKADKFKELNATDDLANFMIQDFANAFLGYLIFLGIGILGVYLFEMFSTMG